ncbi:hypothetical protein VTN00DRAFT_7721 [Thermoascus crustaceus]|uniref:uncharacterized protein n=1 Tax=Thermoascus crustaceus TaxID=5088 RepID=UPI0037434D82
MKRKTSCAGTDRTFTPEEEEDDELALSFQPPQIRVSVPDSVERFTDTDEDELAMDTQRDGILTRHRRSVAPTASPGPHKPSSDLHSSFHWIHTVEKLESQLKSVNEDLSRTRAVTASLQMALEKSQKECAETRRYY